MDARTCSLCRYRGLEHSQAVRGSVPGGRNASRALCATSERRRDQFILLSAAPADNAALTFNGTASTSYVRNIAWHEDAFELAVVKMIDLAQFGGWGAVKSNNGFSVRVFRQAAISSDSVGNRVDALYGWATVYPEQASQQVGA